MEPLREAGLPVHWALGNHDDRTNLAKALERDSAIVPELTDHRVMTLPCPNANIFVMDSLYEVNKAPGMLGAGQLAWLGAELDRQADRPAIVFVHHNPFLPEADPPKSAPTPGKPLVNTGLLDTEQLLKVLLPHKQVKALFFGHTHRYHHLVVDGLNLVNLPATGFLFAQGPPLGWMDLRIEKAGARVQLHCLDPKHPLQNEVLDLKWRA
jgi:3',5'-cyclic AMP phosphodiesterase CpdA